MKSKIFVLIFFTCLSFINGFQEWWENSEVIIFNIGF